MNLRPYQTQVVKEFLDKPEPQRMFFAWEMGAGKTLAAITCAQETAKLLGSDRFRLLVICPAIVRPMWERELVKAFGEDYVGAIKWSTNAALPKHAVARRAVVYNRPIKVTSFELCGFVENGPWDFMIIDEVHNLRKATSIQSKRVRAKIAANPDVRCLGLSGTLIPNEAKQLWNPVDTFFPGAWGEPKKTGDGSWAFESEFCYREESSYGVNYHGLREDKRARLEAKLAPLVSRIVASDFASFLPPLFVEPLFADEIPDPIKMAKKWFAEISESVTHVGIYCHLRETAKKIFEVLNNPWANAVLITGDMPVEMRDRRLEECRQSSKSLIVGTTHALNEGVSLSFQKAALVSEWTTSVDQTLQFIGRFARQDSTNNAATNVHYIVGPNDVGRADKIRARIESINAVLTAGESERRAENLFRPYEMSEDAFAAEVSRLCAGVAKRGNLWGDDDDETDDD